MTILQLQSAVNQCRSHVASLLLMSCLLSACGSGPIDTEGVSAAPLEGDAILYSTQEEADRTWRAAMVRVPDGTGGVIETTVDELESGTVVPDRSYPVVIWMHGCNGFWSGTRYRINWLARQGFVVFAPLSLAREFYPKSCDIATFESGLYRPTLKIRQLDVAYAIEKARVFAWADTDNFILAGLSEGAAVAATYTGGTGAERQLKARVVEGWVCHAGWGEFVGINAPDNQAVLSVVGDRDPWYTSSYHQGDCGEFMVSNNGSQSFVANYEPARDMHELWERPEIQELISLFLSEQLLRDVP